MAKNVNLATVTARSAPESTVSSGLVSESGVPTECDKCNLSGTPTL